MEKKSSFIFYTLLSFYTACEVGTFGDKCAENCNKNCYGSQNACNSVTGACSLGCDDGYQGERCETCK